MQDKVSVNFFEMSETNSEWYDISESYSPHQWLIQNPFYILNVSMQTTRSDIIESAELLMLEGKNDELIQSSISQLTNVKRRIKSELRWFPGESEDTIAFLLKSLESPDLSIELLNYRPLSRINYCLCGLTQKGRLISMITNIDRAFSLLDAKKIQSDINIARSKAEIPLIDSKELIDDGISDLYSDTISYITELLEEYTLEKLAKTLTNLAEYTISLKRYGRIIEGILSYYELRIDSSLSEYKKIIEESCTALLDKLGNSEIEYTRVSKEVDQIIRTTENFDRYAQPLQLLAQAKGQKHAISSDIASSLRNFAVELHNEYDLTDEAIKISVAMTRIFAEAADIIAQLKEDLDFLEGRSRSANNEDTDEEYEDEEYECDDGDNALLPGRISAALKNILQAYYDIRTHNVHNADIANKGAAILNDMTLAVQYIRNNRDDSEECRKLYQNLVKTIEGITKALVVDYHLLDDAFRFSMACESIFAFDANLKNKVELNNNVVEDIIISLELDRRKLKISQSQIFTLVHELRGYDLMMISSGKIYIRTSKKHFADRDEYTITASGFKFHNFIS